MIGGIPPSNRRAVVAARRKIRGFPSIECQVIQGPGDRGADLEAVDAIRFPFDFDPRPVEPVAPIDSLH